MTASFINNEPINDPINDLNAFSHQLYSLIASNPGIKRIELTGALNKSISTVRREIKKLTDLELIEFIGSLKTGGYFVRNKK